MEQQHKKKVLFVNAMRHIAQTRLKKCRLEQTALAFQSHQSVKEQSAQQLYVLQAEDPDHLRELS